MTELSEVKDFIGLSEETLSMMLSHRNALKSKGKALMDALKVLGIDKAPADVTDADLNIAGGGRFSAADKLKLLKILKGLGRNRKAHEATATEAPTNI